MQLPEICARVSPAQVDDLLVAAPDYDRLGVVPCTECFMITSVGVSIPRSEDSRAKSRRLEIEAVL